MSRSKNRTKQNDKPKRPTLAQQRVGSKIFDVEPTSLGPSYKMRPVRRHRGPITAGAVPGTGKNSQKNKKK